MSFTLKAVLTSQARILKAQQLINGEGGVRIVNFSVGTEGYDPLDPSIALAPSPVATQLGNEVFNKNIDSVEWINDYTPIVNCVLSNSEAVTSLGELGLFAVVLTDSTFLNLQAGDIILYALVHFPRYEKTNIDNRTYKIALPT